MKIEPFLTSHTPLRETLEMLRKCAAADYPVLILGETGTGKELLARFLHASSERRKGPFLVESGGMFQDSLIENELFGHVPGAFSSADTAQPGLLRSADGGTLFLDGVENATPALQTKLLRFLQEGTIRPVGANAWVKLRVRMVSASSKPLAQLRQVLREDFFFRIGALTLEIPPLRRRPEDIPLLARHFASDPEQRVYLSASVLAALSAYSWPGNVRELRNELMNLHLRGGKRPRCLHLSPAVRFPAPPPASGPSVPDAGGPVDFHAAMAATERRFLREALFRNRFNQSRTARELRVSRTWLCGKLNFYQLKAG